MSRPPASSGRLRLPRIDIPVEPRERVRERARGRIRVVGAAMASVLMLIGLKGFSLCLWPDPRTLDMAASQRFGLREAQAHRGDILDRNGHRLSTSVISPAVAIDPSLIAADEVDELARDVAGILGLDVAEVAARRRGPGRYAVLAQRVQPEEAVRIKGLDHRALIVKRNFRRFYPEGDLASSILGFVDSRGVGVEGLESTQDDYLRGADVMEERLRDRRGRALERTTEVFQVGSRGMDVHTTIDRMVQRITERALAGVMERHEPIAVSAIVVDVKSGDILAMANVPTFNPNALSERDAPYRRNRVVQDAVEPGSVLKPFTVAAAIEEGLVTEGTVIATGRSLSIGSATIHDDHPHDAVTVSELIKYSSNIGAARLALDLGASRLLPSLRSFGFGRPTGLPLAGERYGTVRSENGIRPIELATTSYGQGFTATVVQLAMAVATIANDGARMKPRLVTRVLDPYGIPIWVQEPEAVEQVISAETAHAVTRAMITVTEDGGTGTRARVPGFRVAGKTGTAEKVKDGHYSSTARIATFMGFVPADDPRLAIVVMADEPSKGSRYGGIVSAPAFAEIAGETLRYLGVSPDPALLGDAHADVHDEALASVHTPMALDWVADAWTMPDLEGRPLREVLAGFQGTGLTVDFDGSGRVRGQHPAPGALVSPGTTVSVVLR